MINVDRDYALSVGLSDLERMTMLAEIYMPYCAEFLIRNGLKPGLKVADIGCGPGNTSLSFYEQSVSNIIQVTMLRHPSPIRR